MSTHHVSKPRAANQSITEECGRPGTCRSKVGVAAIEEPCTNSIVPCPPCGLPQNFSHRYSRTSPFRVQCSCPVTGACDCDWSLGGSSGSAAAGPYYTALITA